MIADVTIRKQKIKIKTHDQVLAFAIRKKFTETLQYSLLDVLNNVFAKYNFTDEYIYINKLQLQLDKINTQQFDKNFLKLFEEKLHAEIHKTLQPSLEKESSEAIATGNDKLVAVAQRTPVNEQQWQTVLYFLRNGYLPWWFKEDAEISTASFIKNVCKACADKLFSAIAFDAQTVSRQQLDNIITRLLAYTSDATLQHQVEDLILKKEAAQRKFYAAIFTYRLQIIKLLNIPAKIFEKELLHLLFSDTFAHEAVTLADVTKEDNNLALQKLASAFHNIMQLKNNVSNEKESKTKQQPAKKNDEAIFLYINNSGVVILHPFLESLFKELGLLDDKSLFISTHAKHRAAVILYYLQSGSAAYKEWEMVFNKIICDIPHEDVIENDVELTNTEIKECDNLLQVVINYWEALRGASKEALQQTFLQRNGKLSFNQNHWLLQVEKTGTNILLERLPWSYSAIKFPWLSKMIYTEW